jgi:hypothetical protein
MVKPVALPAALAAFLIFFGGEAKAADGPAPPRWLTDLGQARREAKASGRPIFVVFRCEH